MYKSVLSLVRCLFFFLSCQKGVEMMSNGSLNIALTDGAAITRILPDALSSELRQQFMTELLCDRGETIVPKYKGTSKGFEDQEVFKIGSYQLRVHLGENPALELDIPYYYEEVQDTAIEKGKATTVSVDCGVANTLVTFKTVNQGAFDKRSKDYYVKVIVGGRSVTWKPGDVTHPYFRAGGRVTTASVDTSTEAGQEGSYALNPIETVKAGVKYDYRLSVEVSDAGSEITTEARQEPVTTDETVPDSWLPKVKVFSKDFDENHVLTYTEAADALSRASIAYTALRLIQDVEFALNFADKHLGHLNRTYLPSELSEEDRRALVVVSIMLPDLAAGNTEGTIDSAGVTPGTLTHGGGQDTDNVIAVCIKANDRRSDAGMHITRTVKPTFKVGYYSGNVWTKGFTLNTLTADSAKTGNLDKFTDIAYGFSADGNSWEAMPGDLRKAGLGPGTFYYVRAKYRGEVPGEKVEVKTYPQIPSENRSLEGATILAEDDNDISRGTIYGWDGWTTLSRTSTPGETAIYSLNSCSGCRPTDDGYMGKGVRVITLGCVMGGSIKPRTAMRNELYLGTNVGDDGDREYGTRFSSRPTTLGVWYKCVSNRGDDVFLIKVQLPHDDMTLGENSFTMGATGSYQHNKLTINCSEDLDKIRPAPNRLLALFKSGTKEPLSVDDLKGFIGKWSTTDRTADAAFRGNGLLIDDVELIYDK